MRVRAILFALIAGCSEASDPRDAAISNDASIESDAAAPDAEVPDVNVPDAAMSEPPALGVLQFRVRHNLEDDTCVARGDCNLSFEDEQDPAAWQAMIAPYTTQASLHFDRALPWATFADEPPAGSSPVDFYDARLDPALLRYLEGHRDQFQTRDRRYLAVSILGGIRDRVASARSDTGAEIILGERCGPLDPLAELELPGGRRFRVLDTYHRFVAYLAAKLEPTDLALMVEVDLFWKSCPQAWDGLVASYRELHQRMRTALGPGVRLFATFTVTGLLGFDNDRCTGPLEFVPCGEPAPPADPIDANICFPLDRRPLTDFEQDGRLDLLALSYYPSGFGFATPGRGQEDLEAYPGDSDVTGPCWMHARLPDVLDPLDQIAELDWNGEIGIAEWSARSAPTYVYLATTTSTIVLRIGATLADQAWWTDRLLSRARTERYRFVNASFLVDYPPVGLWAVQRGPLDATLFNLINTWSTSGLLDRDGRPKSGVTELWTP